MRNLTLAERVLVFLDSLEHIEYKHKKSIIELYGDITQIFTDNQPIERYLKSVGKEGIVKSLRLSLSDREIFETAVESALEGADDVITLASNGYPSELRQIPTPPIVLYTRGNTELLKSKKFAIVGSRRTLPLYAKKAEEISSKLADGGTAIVTGIADGADTSAIKGALKSGRVISVFAGEVKNAYPVRANELARKIIEAGGLIISEYPSGTVPRVYSYPVRNRIIAGLSLGTLIVSGEFTSGTRYTAGYAADYGKEVFALPYGLGTGGEICKSLIKNGAAMVESAEEIAECLGLSLVDEKNEDIELTETEKAVYKFIKQGIGDTDEIAERSQIAIYEIISALGMLELKGLVIKDGSGSYGAIK